MSWAVGLPGCRSKWADDLLGCPLAPWDHKEMFWYDYMHSTLDHVAEKVGEVLTYHLLFTNPSLPFLSLLFFFLFAIWKCTRSPRPLSFRQIQLFCYRHLCMWGSVRVCECACALSWTGCLLAVGFFYFLQCLPSPGTLIDKARSRYLWDKTICFFYMTLYVTRSS